MAEAVQRSLAALFAPHCAADRWSSHGTSMAMWRRVEAFVRFVAEHQPALAGLEALSLEQPRRRPPGGAALR
ncbi:hypothetical protein ACWC5I_06610 [Kitasatospora sp. NPDC001574]